MTQAGTRSATPSAVPRFTRLEAVDPADVARDRGIDPLAYLPDMDVTDSPVLDELLARAAAFDFDAATEADVRAALAADRLSPEGFGALLSPAAEPLLEELAAAARRARRRWFGSTAYLFTPLYLANYCDNHCVYCGFNRDNDICRARLDRAGIVAELDAIAATGLEEILLLTGEDRARTDPAYIGEACKLAAERFRMVGVEVYPMNEDEYAYLHECGVDYVTVFQETYDPALYGKLHLAGRKRVFPYRANAQERAMRGGMRGAAFGALLGLGDFRRDAYACGLHAWLVQRAYPHAELSLSCPRLRPIAGNGSLGPRGVGERQLLQVMCAYRLLLPQAGITISSRERAGFRDRAMGIAATKISAGVSTGVGEHADGSPAGDDQFEIADGRDVAQVRAALRGVGLEPVMNDYVRLCSPRRRPRRFGACSSPTASAALSRCREQTAFLAESGAIDAVILREKDLDDAAYELLAAEMAAVCARCGIAFVAHAHVEAARRLGCAAVHLPLPLLRAQGRPDGFAWVGTNVHEADEVAEAEVLGPTCSSRAPCSRLRASRPSTARGLPFLRAVLDRAHAPVFALGGITDENERLIREAGAAGACRMADYARRRGVRQAAPCKYERSRG